MDFVLEEGKPIDVSTRDDNEVGVYQALDLLGISYLRVDHSPLVSMEEYQLVEDKLQVMVAKNLFLSNRQQTKFYLLLMPGDKPFKTKEISNQINSARLSFGQEEQLLSYLHCFKGSTSVFGLLYDKDNQVQLLIDEDLLKEEFLGFHPCMNTSTIKIRMADLLEKFLPYTNHDFVKVKLICE